MFEMDHGIFPCMKKKEQAHVPTKKIQVKGSNEPVTQ